MLEQLYGRLGKISSGLEDRRYRFHRATSGLHSLPNSVDEFYALACCDEVHLDYRNFTFSATRSLSHLLGHQEAIFDSILVPSENFLDMEESKGISDKEKLSLFDITIQARVIRNRLYGSMVESQMTGKTDCLISLFNEAMGFYMKNLLPEISRIYKKNAEHLESKRSELVKEHSKNAKSRTPAS